MNHVLVVDDDSSIVSTVREVLKDEGYEVATAMDGQAALRRIDQDVPALVLLDMRMPIMDGWQFAAEVRRRGLDLPIVVMTAAQDAQRWAGEIGADGYVSKPFDIDDLLGAVARHRNPSQPGHL